MSYVHGWRESPSRILGSVPPLHPVLAELFAEREAALEQARRDYLAQARHDALAQYREATGGQRVGDPRQQLGGDLAPEDESA